MVKDSDWFVLSPQGGSVAAVMVLPQAKTRACPASVVDSPQQAAHIARQRVSPFGPTALPPHPKNDHSGSFLRPILLHYSKTYSRRPRVPFRVVLVQLQTRYIFVVTLDVGLALRATAGKRPFRSFSFSAFLVHFVNTKKIETGLLSCLYFLGSPSWTRTNDIVINSHALYRLSYWGI